jgi:hypothetical protein
LQIQAFSDLPLYITKHFTEQKMVVDTAGDVGSGYLIHISLKSEMAAKKESAISR